MTATTNQSQRNPNQPRPHWTTQVSLLQGIQDAQVYWKPDPKDLDGALHVYTSWVAMEVLHQVIQEKNWAWKPGRTTRRRNLKPLMDRIPPDYRRFEHMDLPRAVSATRRHWFDQLYRQPIWFPTKEWQKVLVASAYHSINGQYPPAQHTRAWASQLGQRKPIRLSQSLTIHHWTLANLLADHGIGSPHRKRGVRGYSVTPWKVPSAIRTLRDNHMTDFARKELADE